MATNANDATSQTHAAVLAESPPRARADLLAVVLVDRNPLDSQLAAVGERRKAAGADLGNERRV